MKIGFIHIVGDTEVEWFKPLSYGYLKSYLSVHFKHAFTMDYLEVTDNWSGYSIICISSTSPNYQKAKSVAKVVRKKIPDAIVIIGGQHITFLPQTLSDEFDLAVVGEGEETLLELMTLVYENGMRLKGLNLHAIKGIAFSENGVVIKTDIRELIEPLDRIPFPDRSEDVRPYLFSSRGCPYDCSFCSSTVFWKKARYFSPEYFVKEVEFLIEKFPSIEVMTIWDDLFFANKNRYKKIIDLLENKNITKKVAFESSIRANLVNDELCHDLKRMNVKAVAFGAESGSDRILNSINKKSSVQENQIALDLFFQYQIPVHCTFVVGFPTETEEDVRKTYEFLIRNILLEKISIKSPVNILMPLPGTKMWTYAVENRLIGLDGFDWSRLSVFSSFRDSNAGDLKSWIELRRKKKAIYLAEDTLPQERLYELMELYEEVIKKFEDSRFLKVEYERLILTRTFRLHKFIDQSLRAIKIIK